MEKSIYSESHAAFCRILRSTREGKGITQTALAQALGRPQSFVAKIESGQRRVDVVEFVTIAKGLETSPEKLMAKFSSELLKLKRPVA